METRSDVVIISAYGRGHWIAAELKSRGLSVSLADVTEHVGRWSPEDVEGPFGLFQTPLVTSLQKARLDEEDYAELVEDGFVVWLKGGPLDMRGPHAAYLASRAGIDDAMLEYVRLGEQMPEKRRSELLKKWAAGPFARSWFVNLAHSLGSNESSSSRQAQDYGRPLPLTEPLQLRRVSRRGAEKSLQWVESQGVKVFSKAKIREFAHEGSEFYAVELEDVTNGLLRADRFVWCLSSSETKKYSARLFAALFPNGELLADWVWTRYRVVLDDTPVAAAVPAKVLVIGDVALQWTHANLLWLQRTTGDSTFDVWLRLPEMHRFQKAYLERLGEETIQLLRSRLPGVDVKITEWPQEYSYDAAVLGPALYQLYDPDRRRKFRPRRFRNLQFDGPETWASLDWTGRFASQQKIVDEIQNWKNDRDRKSQQEQEKGHAVEQNVGRPPL
jgi:hypothetical protein